MKFLNLIIIPARFIAMGGIWQVLIYLAVIAYLKLKTMKNIFFILLITMVALSCGKKDDPKPTVNNKTASGGNRDTVAILKIYGTKMGTVSFSADYQYTKDGQLMSKSWTYSFYYDATYTIDNPKIVVLKCPNFPTNSTTFSTLVYAGDPSGTKSIKWTGLPEFVTSESIGSVSGYTVCKGIAYTTFELK